MVSAELDCLIFWYIILYLQEIVVKNTDHPYVFPRWPDDIQRCLLASYNSGKALPRSSPDGTNVVIDCPVGAMGRQEVLPDISEVVRSVR